MSNIRPRYEFLFISYVCYIEKESFSTCYRFCTPMRTRLRTLTREIVPWNNVIATVFHALGYLLRLDI